MAAKKRARTDEPVKSTAFTLSASQSVSVKMSGAFLTVEAAEALLVEARKRGVKGDSPISQVGGEHYYGYSGHPMPLTASVTIPLTVDGP